MNNNSKSGAIPKKPRSNRRRNRGIENNIPDREVINTRRTTSTINPLRSILRENNSTIETSDANGLNTFAINFTANKVVNNQSGMDNEFDESRETLMAKLNEMINKFYNENFLSKQEKVRCAVEVGKLADMIAKQKMLKTFKLKENSTDLRHIPLDIGNQTQSMEALSDIKKPLIESNSLAVHAVNNSIEWNLRNGARIEISNTANDWCEIKNINATPTFGSLLECPVCFEPLLCGRPTVVTSCGHMFCLSCMNEIRSKGTDTYCPLCRIMFDNITNIYI